MTAEATEVEDEEVDPMKARLRSGGLDLGNLQEPVDVEGNMGADEDDGIGTSSTGMPESGSGLKPEAFPAPDPPSLSVQLPSPQGAAEWHPDPAPPP